MNADVEAARLVLARLGVTPEQLLAGSRTDGMAAAVPTLAAYVEQVEAASSQGTRAVYESYWRRVVEQWGERRLDEVTALEISQFAERTRRDALVRRNSRGGRGAAEHLIGSLRCLYRHAVADGLINEADNPSIRVAKPRRLAGTRRALPDARLAEIISVATTTGNDPELDGLLVRLHLETACRRGGALALVPGDLDPDQCLIRLREKGDTVRWQPVSPSLMRRLCEHAAERPAEAGRPLLRYRVGRPISARRYDYLWTRVGRHLPWAAAQQVSTHWLRHTTLTWVERHFGYAVARAYAGHHGRDVGTTATYVRADVHEVAAALSALTGEPHPLAVADQSR